MRSALNNERDKIKIDLNDKESNELVITVKNYNIDEGLSKKLNTATAA